MNDQMRQRIALRSRIIGHVSEPSEMGLAELEQVDALVFALMWSQETSALARLMMAPVVAAVEAVRRENADLFGDAGEVIDADYKVS